MQTREGRVTVARLPIHYLEWRSAPDQGATGDGASPLLLLHGFLDHAWSFLSFAESYHRQAAALDAPPRRIVAIDLRGHGDSGWVEGGYYHFPDYLLDVMGVADALGAERFSLLGHSMGGMAACLAAGTFPERIDRLALVEGLGPQGMTPEDAPGRFMQWVEDVRAFERRSRRGIGSLEEAAASLRRLNGRLPEDLARFLAEKGTRRRPDGRLAWKSDPLHRTRAPQPFYLDQASAFWRRVRCPVLFISGSESEFRRFDVSDRLACFSDARRAEIAGAGHMVHHDRPESLAKTVLAFLQDGELR
jgi:pimeloyl-ACP methyl ester carboxylesterase